jgi:hypothetical protein
MSAQLAHANARSNVSVLRSSPTLQNNSTVVDLHDQTESAIAHIVAGTRFPVSYCASLRLPGDQRIMSP